VALTPRQQRFVNEYVIDLNATAAAKRAGYSEKAAKQQGTRLLTYASVTQAIDAALEKRAKATEITAERVLTELALLGFANMLDYIVPQGDGSAFVDLTDLTREQAAAIQELTVEEFMDGKGEDARPVRRTKFKLAAKRDALELLGKHIGLFPNKTQWNGELLVKNESAVPRPETYDAWLEYQRMQQQAQQAQVIALPAPAKVNGA
jgi:phage terminase small subunit